MVAVAGGGIGQTFQRGRIALRQAGPLGFSPALELGQAREIKAVEKGPTVEGHRSGEVGPVQCRLKVAGVHADGLGVQPKRSGAAEEDIFLELLAELEHGLLQVVAGPVGIALGPEEGEHPVPAHPLFAAQSNQGQQRQRALPGDRPRHRAVLIFNGEAAEGPEAQHLAGGGGVLTWI